MKVKAPLPMEKRTGVVYEIPCQDCEKVYIGETGRSLQKRMMEHKAAVRRGDRNNGIAVHAWDEDHRINWEGANIKGGGTATVKEEGTGGSTHLHAA